MYPHLHPLDTGRRRPPATHDRAQPSAVCSIAPPPLNSAIPLEPPLRDCHLLPRTIRPKTPEGHRSTTRDPHQRMSTAGLARDLDLSLASLRCTQHSCNSERLLNPAHSLPGLRDIIPVALTPINSRCLAHRRISVVQAKLRMPIMDTVRLTATNTTHIVRPGFLKPLATSRDTSRDMTVLWLHILIHAIPTAISRPIRTTSNTDTMAWSMERTPADAVETCQKRQL